MDKIVLIDGHSIMNRAFYGVPPLTDSRGRHTNAIYGFLNILFKILDEENPEYLTVAFDMHAPTFRHELYKEYKGTRKPMPEELRQQIPLIKEVLEAMEIHIVQKEGLEADDILGTIAKKAEKDGMEVSLVSGDRDLLQIADEHIKIRIPKTKGQKTEIFDYYAQNVLEEYKVTPKQFIELKALMGDTADNIPGVPKVGEKTATELMVTYGSIDEIYSNLDKISKKSIRESLANNRELADLSMKLATIKTDADISFSYEKAKLGKLFTQSAYALFRELSFKNFLGRFESTSQNENTADSNGAELSVLEAYEDWKSVIAAAKKSSGISIKTVKVPGLKAGSLGENESGQMFIRVDSDDGIEKDEFLCLISYFDDSDSDTDNKNFNKNDNRVFGYKTNDSLIMESMLCDLQELVLGLKESKLYCFDIKSDYQYIFTEKKAGELLSGEATDALFDCKIAAYLLDPLKSDYEVADIAGEYAGITLQIWSEVFGKTDFASAYRNMNEKCMAYLADEVCALKIAGRALADKLRQTGMYGLFRDLEMPLSYVLYYMEKAGIMVKPDELKAYGDALQVRIVQLEGEIHEAAGEDFNINSPKQLGEILFGKLGLPGAKKTKTGYSTAAEVLEKLAPQYPIVSDILEYRMLTKLKSTYADGLVAYIQSDSRIHTSFNQTITATGRLSSTEPNLQNIPMRTELGRRIRKIFIPKEGCVFMDADYSQIELRVLAHMSKDAQLIEAYRQDEDIHRITASKVFNTPISEVTDLQRRNAKAVNFGIVYGISSFGLSQDLSISQKEAKLYIEEYFRTYPAIKEFLDQMVINAKERGYSESAFGRRRPIPELKSSNFMQRSFGERVAMNSPIQGTAADIIKYAMINVFDALRRKKLKSRLILQIHDELLIETEQNEIDEVRTLMIDEMQNVCDLAVKLEVDLHTGTDWYEAK